MALFLLSAGASIATMSDVAIDPDYPAFARFLHAFRGGHAYSTEMEMIGRFSTFKANLKLAEERNAKGVLNAKPGQKPETHGITQFMDLTADEFKAKYTGLRPPKERKWKASRYTHPNHGNVTANAKSIDWNARGAVTPIKNQGQCGSCWAFSATEQLESAYFLQYGDLKELSPQQVTSCTTSCLGCNGGNPIDAWAYISGFGGQEPSADYPYTSGTTQQTGSCRATASEVAEDVGPSYTMIADTPAMESNMLAQIQDSPMSVCVDATLWQTYTGGVITAQSGCGTAIDHAVQATGFSAEGNYWIVRNSWGPEYGEAGFVYVEYGANVCGITDQATIVSVEKPASSK